MLQEKLAATIITSLSELVPLFGLTETTDFDGSTVIFGNKGCLPSMGLVTLIADLEERLEADYGVLVTLADERAMSQKHSPFRTVESLTKYIIDLMNGSRNE